MIGFFAAMAVATASSCPPVDGAAALFTEKTKYVWVGEVHGTAEEPALFGDLVCQAAATRPVVVALERDVAEQPLWNAYLTSDGGAAARAAHCRSASRERPAHAQTGVQAGGSCKAPGGTCPAGRSGAGERLAQTVRQADSA